VICHRLKVFRIKQVGYVLNVALNLFVPKISAVLGGNLQIFPLLQHLLPLLILVYTCPLDAILPELRRPRLIRLRRHPVYLKPGRPALPRLCPTRLSLNIGAALAQAERL
jgi:hypothetical protein